MRIVEYSKPTTTTAYRALWALGIVAGLFSLVVCAFMIANNLRLKASDPIHTPALQTLVQELKSNPQNEALKEQIREMDLLARRAFFTSQHFNATAIWLLLGGLSVTVLAFKSIYSYRQRVPYPDGQDPKDDLAANARWARQSVTVVGLLLLGLALSLALPWKSPLDRAANELAPAFKPDSGKPAPKLTSVPPVAPTAFPNAAERRKHWPSFRGPAGGLTLVTNLPTQWDGKSGQGVAWKTPLPLPGFGSPIVWGDRVFVSGASQNARAVYALDARKGQMLWEQAVATKVAPPTEMPEVMEDTGYAASTMTTDGQAVFAIFATGDMVAFDFSGRLLWTQFFGVPVNPYGHSSSLEVFEDTVIVQFDHKETGFVAALDTKTGATRWKTPRKLGPSWASPLLAEVDGHTELVLIGDAYVTSYDPKTGRQLWQLKCLVSADVAASPIFAHGLVFASAEHLKFCAINPRSREVLWENKTKSADVGTPVAVGQLLIAGLSDGGIVAWDALTGKTLWHMETDDGFYASPIATGSRVYLLNRLGKMIILEATPQGGKVVAEPNLGEAAVTTPAIYGESLILRGAKNLYRIGP